MAAPEENELPDAYGRSRVALLPIDPHHVHVYWEVTPEDCLGAAEQLGKTVEAPRWVLRFYDVGNAHGSFDVFVELGARSWYVDLWSAEKSYFVELGLLAGDHFVAVCRSSAAETPRAGPSSSYEPQWATVSASPEAALRAEPAPDPDLPEPPPPRTMPDAPRLAEQRSRAAGGTELGARAARAPSRSTSLGGSSSSGGPAG